MKKTFALLLACLMLVAMLPGTAMAYTAPELSTAQFTHTLSLTYALNELDGENPVIAYKYTVGEAQNMVMTQTGTDGDGNPVYTYSYGDAKGVSRSPVIKGNYSKDDAQNYVVFNKDSIFDTNKTSTVTVNVEWSDVKITEPGIYLWEVTKALDTTITTVDTKEPSDNDNTLYLYAIVTRQDNDTLTGRCGFSKYKALNNKQGGVEDQYPARTVTLTVAKEIAGNMASSNQYFSFTINLQTVAGDYTVTGNYDSAVPETIYNSDANNESSINVATTGKGEKVFWLKSGQNIVINGLPYGTTYSIVEANNNGYRVDATLTGDTDAAYENVSTDFTVTDTTMTSDTTVTFTNTKSAPVPTGISLHTAAPVMGILLAMSLLAILFVGKRKEYVA